MKLYLYTAIGPRRNICSEISPPAGEKMLMGNEIENMEFSFRKKNKASAFFMNDSVAIIEKW
jgi:hypothetical protein